MGPSALNLKSASLIKGRGLSQLTDLSSFDVVLFSVLSNRISYIVMLEKL